MSSGRLYLFSDIGEAGHERKNVSSLNMQGKEWEPQDRKAGHQSESSPTEMFPAHLSEHHFSSLPPGCKQQNIELPGVPTFLSACVPASLSGADMEKWTQSVVNITVAMIMVETLCTTRNRSGSHVLREYKGKNSKSVQKLGEEHDSHKYKQQAFFPPLPTNSWYI